jgi:hypothetical protein
MMANNTTKNEAFDHIETVEKGIASRATESLETFDVKAAARIRHHIDWRLIPALGAMYGT